MRVLLLAPHPFYQERGTPIAVDLLLRALSDRGDTVDLLTFHVGEDRVHGGVKIHRIPPVSWIHNVPPGFSLRKVICDVILMGKARKLMKTARYDVVHAVEEAVFMAMLLKRQFGVPYVCDMDSSLPQQIVEKNPCATVIAPLMRWFERKAIRGAAAVAAVCDAVADVAREAGSERITILRDISLLSVPGTSPSGDVDLPELPTDSVVFMYIGNLQRYQGIDLLLESFAQLRKSDSAARLVVVGGSDEHVARYREKARRLHVGKAVHFVGPRPLTAMGRLFEKADVLVSPRITGGNTPMKIYSYLDSGRAVLATDLPTHTQVLSPETARLAHADPGAFAEAMVDLARHPETREALAAAARQLVREKYCYRVFRDTVNALYDGLEHSE